MKKLLAILAICGALSACAAPQCDTAVPSIVIKDHYVVSPIPDEDLVIPAQVPDIDADTATQKDVSSWLAATEGRSNDMEIKLKNIAKIQADQKAQAQKQNGN